MLGDEEDEDWNDDEWEDGVITNVNDDGTVDIELESGEEITGMDPDLLDVEDDDIGVGTEVGVNMEDVEWEEFNDDESDRYEDEEDWDEEEDWDDEEEDWDEEDDWDDGEAEYVTGTIESFNEDGTANIRLSTGELLESVNLDDMIPMDGEDGELSEGDGVHTIICQDLLLSAWFESCKLRVRRNDRDRRRFGGQIRGRAWPWQRRQEGQGQTQEKGRRWWQWW